MSDRRPAATIQELDVHLGYVQQAIGDLQKVVASMATKQDIDELAKRMETFASKEDLARLQRQVQESTTESKLKALAGWATSILAIFGLCVALWAGAIEVVHWRDALSVKKP
jgi:hypothetical protein